MKSANAIEQTSGQKHLKKRRGSSLRDDIELTLLAVPTTVWYIIFCYLPMFGLIIAFKDYNVFDGIWDSPWVGLEHFKTFFSSSEFGKLLTNTLTLRGCLTARLLLPLLLLQPPARILPLRCAGVWRCITKISITVRPLA